MTDCAISLFCNYYFKINPQIIYFSNNELNCNSRQEVQDKCKSVGTHEYKNDTINIYPNPGNGRYNMILPCNFTGTLNVTNNLGAAINYIYFNNIIDISNQPPGIYYLKITSTDNVNLKKLIKN
ncbi:MAG TPA: T9SS type A sorting domain-containing protein [Saprospiraceae bacterium]|nr:T9SS type A sorting domain-containing protein [Saprospiraceae bacterium]